MSITEMRVHMDCAGCESKVRSALQKLKGVDSVDIDMVQQKVTVNGYADQKKVLKAARKTGRRAELWQLPYNPDHNQLVGGGGYQEPHACNGPTIHHHAPAPASSYNYYKHGYDGGNHQQGFFGHHPAQASSGIFSHQASTRFSDENPNACALM